MAEVDILMQEKQDDGSYNQLYPITKASNVNYTNSALSGVSNAQQGLDSIVNTLGNINLNNYFTKTQTLTSSTAALFGLGTDAVPDDVLAWIGKYNLYWWKRRTNSSGWKVKVSEQVTESVWVSYNDTTKQFQYSEEVDISESGVITLKNPSSGSIDANTYTNLNVVKGKYWKANTAKLEDKGILYSSPNAPDAKKGSYDDYTDVSMQYGMVTSEYVDRVGEWEYLQSSDRSAYPDSGVQDGYEYQYLGIPFENASSLHVKIATGSYVGTGKYGSSNPNSLTFEFAPKLLFITQQQGNGDFWGIDSIDGNPMDCTVLTTSYVSGLGFATTTESDLFSGYAKKSEDGRTITWYHRDNVSSQLNSAGYTYYYFAIS